MEDRDGAEDREGAEPLIDCHHLLHGLARTGRGVAATVLADAGLDLSAL
ncbi:Clp protease N-terminal domain-containing protein [Streptomyces phaeochromogenes]